MPRSIPASATAELTPLVASARLAVQGRTLLWDVARRPIGMAGLALTGLTVATGLAGPLLAPFDPFVISGASLSAPSAVHPLGTDAIGRDLLSGVLFGARTSLIVAVTVGGLAFAIGAVAGTVAGQYGGRVDEVLMRVTEFFQVVPRFFLAILAIAMFGPGLDRLIIVLGLTSWPVLARVLRAEVLSLRGMDFVRAAEASGASDLRILFRELLPNALPAGLVVLGLLIGQVLLLEASLGFIGLGDPGAMSWGTLAGQAQSFLRVAWWLPLFPGLAITIAVLGLNLLGDALSAALAGR